MDVTRASGRQAFYVTDFLDTLQDWMGRYGNRALKVQIDPRCQMNEGDVELLR